MPKLVLCLRQYTFSIFLKDLIAGLTVGLVALPLAMAFGIASGVTPQAGIYTAVVGGFIVSALGGSRTQIGATGLHSLATLAKRVRKTGRAIVIRGARRQPGSMLDRGDIAH